MGYSLRIKAEKPCSQILFSLTYGLNLNSWLALYFVLGYIKDLYKNRIARDNNISVLFEYQLTFHFLGNMKEYLFPNHFPYEVDFLK